MADKAMEFELDFTGDYDRKDDAPRPPKWLGYTGPVKVTLIKYETGKSGSGNDAVKLHFRALDEDCLGIEFKTTNVPVSGKDKNGKPNILRFVRYIDSIYSFKLGDEDKAKAAVQKLLGTKQGSKKLLDGMLNMELSVHAGCSQFPGDDGLPVFWVEAQRALLKSEYEDIKKQGGARFRRPLSKEAQAWYANAAGRGPRANGTNGAGAGAGSSKGSSDAPDAAGGDPLSVFDNV